MRPQTDNACIVAQIYAAIRSPQTWSEVVSAIAAWLGADMAMMTSTPVPGVASLPIVFHRMDLHKLQGEPLLSHPEFTLRALATGRAPGVFLFDELMSPAEQQTNRYWQTIVAPLQIGSGLLCVARTPDDNQKPVVFAFYRRTGAQPFAAADREMLAELLGHLRRSLSVVLDAPPPTAGAEAHGLYAHIGAPAFLFGRDGKVVSRNRAADLLLQAGDGIALQDERVAMSDKTAQAEFDAALHRVVGENWTRKLRLGGELLARRAKGPPMVLVLTPLGAENPIAQWAAPVRCVMFVLEEELRVVGMLPNRLARIYGLTGAEADIAIGIATGASPQEIARVRGAKTETVRSQVKSAMAKTATRRQSELAGLVNRLRF